ncbi:MAG: energy transducer TonB [Bacteroidales bacterium]|jgi:protein TonB|nr:energy transducer TonB [Bacteroidales bacterium]MDD3299647.1 energy transducer TonB [Bacteroidales bacterium]MDD3843629.1 energy transducer TonB [Bacteroidales bacterium]MDD4618497.1 energy transducer TonB [Bacteroidales bacterium]
MEVKKTPKADLENKKLLFREIGLIVTLLVVLASFEYKTYEKNVSTLADNNAVIIEEEMIPITNETPPPPPEMPKIPVVSDDIIIVDDDVEITTELIINTEDDKNLGVEIREYVQGREEEVIEEEDIPFVMVEEKPKFMGGDENTFTKWVAERLVYPEIAKENSVQGRVILQFRVNTDGSVSDVTVIRGVDPSLDKEAVRVVSSSPKWTPGRQRNKAVRVVYTFPVIFQLR